MPGGIRNRELKSYIIERRRYQGSPLNDNDIGIQKDTDYYEFNEDLWKMFYNNYGCDECIMIRYYHDMS